MNKVSVIGFGAWGTALAYLASHNVHEVMCYTRDIALRDHINSHNINFRNFPEIKLPKNIKATANLEETLDSEVVVIAVPAQKVRGILVPLKNVVSNKALIILSSKGIEMSSGKFTSEVLEEMEFANDIAVLSGPNFAVEVLEEKKSFATVAAKSREALETAAIVFNTQNFLTEMSSDIIGIQACGAIKNVYAIGAGIIHGLELGENFKASFIKNAVAEMRDILKLLGCSDDVLFTYAGIGDLILTCGSTKSRNLQFGARLALMDKERLESTHTVEGYYTANILNKMLLNQSARSFVIMNAIIGILSGNKEVSSFDSLHY